MHAYSVPFALEVSKSQTSPHPPSVGIQGSLSNEDDLVHPQFLRCGACGAYLARLDIGRNLELLHGANIQCHGRRYLIKNPLQVPLALQGYRQRRAGTATQLVRGSREKEADIQYDTFDSHACNLLYLSERWNGIRHDVGRCCLLYSRVYTR